ncbi:hypothetical protein J1N35_011909 [Gossypium stocksii]|uniref:Uncharacterized protein n=1 Tax=Gossypium stocksii TaxID=47602 RepID=A0A9D3W3K2_9ROSI|nr:hypothetical protein J1N35_011909 [Gossypium stocksii]
MSEGSSRKVMTMVLAGNGLVVLASKFKQWKMSAIRDFPPGCGRITAPSSRSSSDAREYLVLYMIRCVIVCFV